MDKLSSPLVQVRMNNECRPYNGLGWIGPNAEVLCLGYNYVNRVRYLGLCS